MRRRRRMDDEARRQLSMRVSVALARSREMRARATLLLRTLTGGTMDIPDWIAREIGDVEEFNSLRLPASLANALRALSDRLGAESPHYAQAIGHLRQAERAAQNCDIRGAREHYATALPIMIGIWAPVD
jgi:hypothetical protein